MIFINDLNLKKQADDLGIKVWQTPGGLFIMMGFVTAIVMAATYFISKNYDNPQVLVVAECFVVSIILIITTVIARMLDQVIKLNKMKSEFVSVASHQLRTPLSAIRWESELLLSKFRKGLDKKQLENIRNIESLSRKMTRLVNDLLDVARIEQRRMILRKQRFDFAKSARKTLSDLKPSMEQKNIELILDFDRKLPMAFGDPEKINLVVENLVTNAFKYTTSGGKIEIKVFKKGNYLIFEVKDNGVGIPEEQHDRVFEKFFRSDNAAKYQTEGTGLGLYIAKNIVEHLGGSVWFQSIENVGSMFSFSLPISQENIK